MGNTASKKEEWKTTLRSTTVEMLLKARPKLHDSLVMLNEKETLAGAMKLLNQVATMRVACLPSLNLNVGSRPVGAGAQGR